MSMEPNKIMLSELDAFCCDFSFIRDLDGSPIDDIMMPMMDDSELESILEDIMDMNDDLDTLQQVPTNSLVHNDVIDLSMDECDEDEIPSFDWISSCSDLSFNDPNMNNTAPPRDTIQMMLDTEQYSFKPIDMNDVQNDDGITNKQRDSVAEWIFKVMDFYGGNKQCAFLAMSYMDRFLQQQFVHKSDVELVSACSLLIAAKENNEVKDNNCIKAMLHLMAPRGGFQKNTVDTMEMRILESTDWMLPPPSPFDFGRELVRILSNGETHTIPHQETIRQLLDHVKFLCELATRDYRFTLYLPSRVAIGAILVALDHNIHTNITGKQRRKLCAHIEAKMGVTITRDNGYDSDIRVCETNLALAFEKYLSAMTPSSRHVVISSRKYNNAEPMHVSANYCKRAMSEVLSHHVSAETPSKKSRAWPSLPVVSPSPMKPKQMIP